MDEPESYKFCKLSLSLSLSFSLECSFFLPSCKYNMSPFELEVVCTDFIGKNDITPVGIKIERKT